MYGDLEGKSKPGLALSLGKEIVQEWRSGYSIRPPPMNEDHEHWHGYERKYSDLSSEDLPITESLEDTMERTLPFLYGILNLMWFILVGCLVQVKHHGLY